MKQTRRNVPIFTIADHLKVQMEIEQRAHELWLAGGSRQDTALDDWLRAEHEVLEEFIQVYETVHLDKQQQKRVGRSSPRSCVQTDARRIG